MKLSAVSDGLGHILNDVAKVTWTAPEIAMWATEASYEIVSRDPSAFSRREQLTLDAGETLQTLAGDTVALVTVLRNAGPTGTTRGRAVRRVDFGQVERIDPQWHKAKPADEIAEWDWSRAAPYVWWVRPAPKAAIKVDVIRALVPPSVTNLTDELALADRYLGAIIDWCAFRCLSKQSEEAGVAAFASGFFASFESRFKGAA